MKHGISKIFTVILLAVSLIISSTLPAYADEPEDKTDTVYVEANETNGDQNVEVGNVTVANGYGVIILASDQKTADVTTKDITVTGYNSEDGIAISAEDGDVNVTVNGNITAVDDSFDTEAYDNSNVTVTVNGNLDSSYGMYTKALGGNTEINVNGNITSYNSGICAEIQNGETEINVVGDINSGGSGIYGDFDYSEEGKLTANITGDINSETNGVFATFYQNGNMDVNITGDIKADENAIYLEAEGDNNQINIQTKGDIEAYNGISSYLYSEYEDDESKVNIDINGTINASNIGIESYIYGNITQNINVEGDITSVYNAIRNNASEGATSNINVTGNIDTDDTMAISIYTRGYKSTSNTNVKGDIDAVHGILTGFDEDYTYNDIDNGEEFMYYLSTATSAINVNIEGNITADEDAGIGIAAVSDMFKTKINLIGDIEASNGIVIASNDVLLNKASNFVVFENEDEVNGYEIISNASDTYYVKDGAIIPLIVDEANFKVYDGEGNLLNIGVYFENADEEPTFYVIDKINKKANTEILVDGNINASNYGLYVSNINEFHDIPVGTEVPSSVLNEILVSGKISGKEASIVLESDKITEDNFHLTVWSVDLDKDGNAISFLNDEVLESNDVTKALEKTIKYIIKIEQPKVGATLSAVNSKGEALDQSYDYDVALEGEKVLLKVNLEPGYKLLAAYNGDGEKVELLMDSNGDYYIVVPKGGGIYLSAECEKEKYHVRYLDDEGNEIASEDIEYGETPSYKGEEPTKKKTQQYTYKFVGWEQIVDEETGEIIFKAKFEEITNEYTITLDLDGGSLNGKTGVIKYTIKYGDSIKLPKPTKDGFIFDYWEGSRYDAGASYLVKGQHKFKAIWKKASTNEDTVDKFKVPNTAVKVEVENTSINYTGIIIPFACITLCAYLIIKMDKRRYNK